MDQHLQEHYAESLKAYIELHGWAAVKAALDHNPTLTVISETANQIVYEAKDKSGSITITTVISRAGQEGEE